MTDTQSRRLVMVAFVIVAVALCGALFAIAAYFTPSTGLRQPANQSETVLLGTPNGSQPAPPPDAGLLIVFVEANTPADRAGLQWGDFLLTVNGQPLLETAALNSMLQNAGAGSTVELMVQNGGSRRTVSVTLASEPPLLGVQVVGPGGLAAQAVTPTPNPDATTDFALPAGFATIVEIDPDSPAAQSDLQVGDVVVAVDDQAILTVAELVTSIQAQAPETAVTLTLRRGLDTLTRDIVLTANPDAPSRAYLGVTLR